MRAALLYPPFMDPRAPQLALPALAAFLREAGAQVALRDLALEGLLYMTEPESLDRCGRLLAGEAGASSVARELLPLFERARELAPWALSSLRDPQAFFDARDWNAAREVLGCIVTAQAAVTDARLKVNLHPIVYAIDGVDSARLRELVAVTADPRFDLFHDFHAERVAARLAADPPDVVGITLTNHQQWLPGLALARMLKARGLFVVLGGALISKFTDALRGLPDFFRIFADAVIAYEGETALLELLAQLHGRRRFADVPNLLYLDGGFVRATRTRVEDVNALPTPDFEGLPLGDYLTPAPVLPILTGKGCYFNRCKFCDIPFINHVSQKPYRIRDPELVVADVRALAQRHDCKHFVITDEALSPKLLCKLAEGFAPYAAEERHFTGYARLEDGFTREVFEQVAAMGVRKLFFGMESASQRMIDHMDKGTTAASTSAILQRCRDAGIRFHVFSIIGLPEESEALARETFQFFIDHRRVLERPGNSFGIRRFSLELRTDYFTSRERYGIEVAEEALQGEFLVGLHPDQWHNSRGLTPAQVERLLSEEFNPALVRTFKSMLGTRLQVWPVGEEFAVLYCAYYRGAADYPFAAALPELDSGARVTIRKNPAVALEPDGDLVTLALPGRALLFPRALLELVTAPHPRSVRELLAELPESDPADAVRGVDALIGAGFLQLRTEPGAGHAPAW